MLRLFTVAFTSLFDKTSPLSLKLLDYTVIKVDEIAELKATAHSILKRLKATELGLLLRALESRGGDVSSCVFYPCGERLCKRVVHEPQVVLYRTFRQPTIQGSGDLKPLPVCSRYDTSGRKVCINPYHYSGVVQLESRDREYSVAVTESKSGESSGFVSNFTQSTVCTSVDESTLPAPFADYLEKSNDWPKPWCFVAYWEHSDRIGPFYHGHQDVINIFETLPKPRGFCLATLARNADVPDVTKRVRNHVGYGLQLSRETDGVWIYNRSDHSIFANGPTLADRTSNLACRHNILVYKVPPGYSLKIYDYAHSPQTCRTYQGPGGCTVPESVRVSFAKGWGTTSSASYCRPFVTSCPCWVEIHFFVSR